LAYPPAQSRFSSRSSCLATKLKIARQEFHVKVITAAEAAQLIKSDSTVVISGSGGGHAVAESVLIEIEKRFKAEHAPRDLCLVYCTGIGDRGLQGASRFAHEGLLKRSICGALVDSPPLCKLVIDNKIESYTLPQGILSQMMREIAGRRPGVIAKTGLHTFVDPRQLGGKQSLRTTEDLVEVVNLGNEEWLRYKPFKIDVAILRGTTADEEGNVTMEQEAILGEMLSTAQAAKASGGIVIVQVKRTATKGTLPPKAVKIPGILVDYIVVDPQQRQTYATEYSPSYAGELRVPLTSMKSLPFDERKVIARRAAMELFPKAICNLGAGVSTGISVIAAEEGILDQIVLTNEQGFIGGAPLTGPDSGTAQNYSAVVEQTFQFDFYDGGGLDLAFLSFALVDGAGNVNVSRFGDKLVGIGGFVNISQNAKRVVFSGSFTAGGLKLRFDDGRVQIVEEGRVRKFVKSLEQICYNAPYAQSEGRTAMFVTERAVFQAADGTLEMVEIAEGIDIERDVLAHMEFRPKISSQLKKMDARLFVSEQMSLRNDLQKNDQARRTK
jgi:propionate CoA-transferase